LLSTVEDDTDSIFLSIQNIVEHHCGLEKWNALSEDERLKYCKRISKTIIDNINDRAYNEVQLNEYNSQEHDFKISFKQEIVARSGIFVAKKKYTLWVIDEEGIPKDKTHTKGLEIIQSSCPQIIRSRLKNIISLLLKDSDDTALMQQMEGDIEAIKTSLPEEIALNIGITSVSKHNDKGEALKGCPYHVKGLLNYRKLVKSLDLEGRVPELGSGMKVKVVYLKPNKWEFDTMSFLRWVKEFDEAGIEIDYNKMVDKTYLHKISFLLEPMGKADMIESFFTPKPEKKPKKKKEK